MSDTEEKKATDQSPPPPPAVPGRPLCPKVGLIGPTSVGKSTYFSVLAQALTDRKWRVEVYDHEEGDLGNRTLHDDLQASLVDRGQFPMKTIEKSDSERLFFRISKTVHREDRDIEREAELRLYDPAGELFEKPDQHEGRANLFSHLKNCTGILVLLDLNKPAAQLEQIWNLSIRSFLAYIRQHKLDHLLEGNSLKGRTAVLFTKADTLPWLSLLRPREADKWLEKQEGLQSLVQNVRSMCGEERTKFFFCSSVGWNRGRANVRSVYKPIQLTMKNSLEQEGIVLGDLIPDPPVIGGGNNPQQSRVGGSHSPVLREPMQVFDYDENDDEMENLSPGVHLLPGQESPKKGHGKYITPWNVVEPLLWVAGIPETE